MNHPKREEWVPYIFGELESAARRQLSTHLKECADCQREVDNWKRSLSRLDAWKLPPVSRPAPNVAGFLTWAAAAAIVLLLGIGVGRLTTRTDVEKVRAAMEPALREELTQELAQMVTEESSRTVSALLAASNRQTDRKLAVFANNLEARRAEDNRIIRTTLEKFESQNFNRFVTLKKDLDTLALNTDAELSDTAQGLVQLATYNAPKGSK